jgi:hypothetical protein
MRPKVDFPTFFAMWAQLRGWDVPDIHWRAVHWLANRGPLAVLRCFRGFGKSTLLAIYNAWRYYEDETYRILHQSESDGTAYKTSRDTQAVLRRHPLTTDLLGPKALVEQWWVEGAREHDARNASMYAKGILSNVTSARADEAQNDDVEVPRNIGTPEAREKLRYRLGEQTHILVPGGRKLYIGTPHTHDSLYDEQERLGADCLTIRMFEREQRIENPGGFHPLEFVPALVFAGIGEGARLLQEGADYQLCLGGAVFPKGPAIDCYAGCAWPARFGAAELLKRRRETRTFNEWDSQYQLHSKPVGDIRLDPDKMVPYAVEPRAEMANRELVLYLGKTRLVGCRARWDCALGKVEADASAFCVVFTDAAGRLYWHAAEGATGGLDEQCLSVARTAKRLHVPSITVELNGPGGFVPAALRKALKQLQVPCGVVEHFATTNKNADILDAFEAPLSTGLLWAHVGVLDGPAFNQMKDWNPAVRHQPDDYIDAAARAIKATPVRIGKVGNPTTESPSIAWRPEAGIHEISLEAE